MNFGPTVKRLVRRLRDDRVLLWTSIGFGALGVAAAVAGPRVLGEATTTIYEGFVTGEGIDFARLHRVLLGVAVIYALASVLQFVQGYILNGVTQRTVFALRAEVEDTLHRLPLRYFDKHSRGDLLSRVTNDIDNVSQTMQQTLTQFFNGILQILGITAMMLWMDWRLALITLVSVPVTMGVVIAIAKRSQPQFVRQWKETGALNGQVEEAFTGHALMRVFGRRREIQASFDTTNERMYEASFKAQFLSGTIMPTSMFVGNLVFVLVAVVGGLRVASGSLSLGEVQAFIQYSRQFQQPLSQIGSMANIMQSGVASAERVFELLDADHESPDPADPATPADFRGRLVFDHVAFSYSADTELITDMNLVAEPGKTVAIVGPTGAGKTTLVNLIMRFYEVDSGAITLDGVNIAHMTRDDLRSRTGMVLQDAWLFGGTIRENIMYGRPDATEEEMLEAATEAHVDAFVHALPEGYDTVIDDEASNVSAGERQLITIARAFLARPAVLILDEATSSVDTRTEVLVQHAMERLRKDRTSFVIAHRLSTIRDADVILVMEHGDIVEQGTHDELVAAGGAYARLYEAQFAAPIEQA